MGTMMITDTAPVLWTPSRVVVTRKFGKFGSAKYVYPRDTMAELRSWFEAELAATLPVACTLYWT